MKDQRLQLNGKNILLRRLESADFEEFAGLVRRSESFHRGLMKLPKARDKFERFLDRVSIDVSEFFLICRKPDGAIVGLVHLSQIFMGPLRSAYLGYGLFAGFTGNGYAREAVRLILRFAFRDLRLHRLEANIQPHNKPSIALAKRLGFTKEGYSEKYLKVGGRWRDHERWAITRENWK